MQLNTTCHIFLAKMQSSFSKFYHNSFQPSNFVFIHFSFLNFKFIPLSPFHQRPLFFFLVKKLRIIFQSLIGLFFSFKKFEEKKIEQLTTIFN